MSLEKVTAERDALAATLAEEKISAGFASSKFIAEKLTLPADIVRACFGKAFKIEDGRLVAYNAAGNKIFSKVDLGSHANFDEALSALVDEYPHKAQIMKPAAPPSGASGPAGPHRKGATITRTVFDAMPQQDRAPFIKSGGMVVD